MKLERCKDLIATSKKNSPIVLEGNDTVQVKGWFFSESMMHFSHCPKNVLETILKRDFEIVFCFESADSNCTAVSKGGKIQNTKLRIEHSTFFGQWK